MAAVTYSDFWGPSVGAYSLLNNKMPRVGVHRRVANREGFRQNKALINALLGVVTGGNANGGHSEISNGRLTANGGVAEPGASGIGTVVDINRNTTAADITALKEFLTTVSVRPPYPRDASGNGGPAFP